MRQPFSKSFLSLTFSSARIYDLVELTQNPRRFAMPRKSSVGLLESILRLPSWKFGRAFAGQDNASL